MHELIRVYARISPPEALMKTALQNTITLLSDFLKASNDAMDWRAFRREIRHCQSAAKLGSLQSTLPEKLDDLLCELGRYFYEQRDLKDAREHLEEIRDFVAHHYGKASAPYARILYTLATTCQDMGDSSLALQHARRALHIARRLRPVNQRLLADCYNDVGYVLRWQKARHPHSEEPMYIHLDKALYLYNRAFDTYALAFDERQEKEVTLKRARQSMCHNNIGVILEQKGDMEGAFRRFHTARSFALRAYDGQNVTIGIYLENMGRIKLKQKVYDAALSYYEEACNIYATAYGDAEHLDVAACFSSMAEVHIGQNDFARALSLFKQALFIYNKHGDSYREQCARIRTRIKQIEPDVRKTASRKKQDSKTRQPDSEDR
jgi:tetratricopeptide (TPR) repeat protein